MSKYVRIEILKESIKANIVETTDTDIISTYRTISIDGLLGIIRVVYPYEEKLLWYIPLNIKRGVLDTALDCSPHLFQNPSIRKEIEKIVNCFREDSSIHLSYNIEKWKCVGKQ